MTALIPEGLEPLAVWDVRAAEWGSTWLGDTRGAVLWIWDHLGGNPSTIRRVEFYVLDGPFAVVYRYALQDEGFKYQDLATWEAAVEPPVIVPLAELPPAHLLKG